MKFLSFILSIYFLALSVVPCADGCESVEEADHAEIIADHDHNGHEHPAGEDLCSPFCSCQCCHTSIAFFPIIDLDDSPVIVQIPVSFYTEQTYSTYLVPLLDPPKV